MNVTVVPKGLHSAMHCTNTSPNPAMSTVNFNRAPGWHNCVYMMLIDGSGQQNERTVLGQAVYDLS